MIQAQQTGDSGLHVLWWFGVPGVEGGGGWGCFGRKIRLDYRPAAMRSCPGAAFRLRHAQGDIHDFVGFFAQNQGFCRIRADFGVS
jgi:hypothetical protein